MSSVTPNAFDPKVGFTTVGGDPKYKDRVPVLDEFGFLDSSLFNIANGLASGGVLNTQGFYYVDAVNGNDGTGDGSISLPFQTINAALAADTANAGANTTVVLSLVGFSGTTYAGANITDNRHQDIVLMNTVGPVPVVDAVTFNNLPVSGTASLTPIGVEVTTTTNTSGTVDYTVDCRNGGWVPTATSSNGSNAGFFYSYGAQTPALTNMPFAVFNTGALTGYSPATPGDWSVVPSLVSGALDTVASDLGGKLNVAVGAVLAGELAVFDDASGDNISSAGILASALYTSFAEAGGGTSLIDTDSAPTITLKTIADNGHPALVLDDTGGLITIQFIPANLDHGELGGIGDDDHTMYVHTSVARTITIAHTFNPSVAGAPFVMGANAIDQLVAGLNADKLQGSQPGDSGVWNAGFADGVEIDNAGIADGQYMAYNSGLSKFLPASPLNPALAQFNADRIRNKNVDDSNIGDTRVLAYSLSNDQLEYVDTLNPALAQFNANKLQGVTIDLTGLANGDGLVYELSSNKFIASSSVNPDIAQFNANRIQGKTVNAAAIADTRVLAYDSGGDEIVYRDVPLATSESFNAAQMISRVIDSAGLADGRVPAYDIGSNEFKFVDIVQETAGVVNVQKKYIIDDIDLKSLSDNALLTVPISQRMVIDSVQVLIKSASGVSVPPTVSAGITGDLTKYVASVALTGGAINEGHRENLTLATLEEVSAGEEVTFSITGAATATGAYTATVMFTGTILT